MRTTSVGRRFFVTAVVISRIKNRISLPAFSLLFFLFFSRFFIRVQVACGHLQNCKQMQVKYLQIICQDPFANTCRSLRRRPDRRAQRQMGSDAFDSPRKTAAYTHAMLSAGAGASASQTTISQVEEASKECHVSFRLFSSSLRRVCVLVCVKEKI